jgi:hypothetical protein
MTMLDDDRLSSLFETAAGAFEVPADGPRDIVARALGSPPDADVGAVEGGDDDSAGDPGDDPGTGDATSPATPLSPRRARRAVAAARRHRVLSAAACLAVLLLVAGTTGALVTSPSSSPRLSTALSPHSRPTPAHTPITATTVPEFSAAGATAGPGGGAAAPYSANSNAQQRLAAPSGATQSPALPKGVVGQPAKIEQTGTLGLSVGRGDLSRAMAELNALAGTYGGFVANSQTQSGAGSGGSPFGTVTLQVPVDNFSAALTQAQRIGRTTSLTTKATDVTGQYVDLQSRIAALEASRQQYLTIMDKAVTLGDVLAVQEQLDTIQGQIEQLQGQLQVLTSETSYSTFTTNVTEGTPAPRPSPLPESGMVRAWHESVGGFVAGVEGVVRGAGPALFVLVCLAVALLGGRALWRRFQRHRL